MQSFEASLRENQEPVQLLLPSVEIALAMKQGVGALIRQAGLQLMQLVMERDVEQMLGPRYQQAESRPGWRWGKEQGWWRIDGQKVPLDRMRVRNVDGGDIPLGSYLSFQHDPQWHSRLWQGVMRGLSTRQYGPVVRRFADAYGIEKSVVSEQFIEASRQKLRELIERPLENLKLCAVMIDGIAFDGETFVVALGIGQDGHKTVLGLRQGATENATVVGELCAELEQTRRGFSGTAAVCAGWRQGAERAVKKRAGEAALLQRCQLHKRRNVLNHLPDEPQPFIEQKLIAAWNMTGYAEAWRAVRSHSRRVRTHQSQRSPEPGRGS